jgi:cell division protein FtsW
MTNHRVLTIITISLTFFGLIMISSASVVDAARDFGDKWYYLKLQGLWALIGLILFFILTRLNHLHYQKYASILFFLTIGLLLLVLLPGIGTKLLGARRWINLGFFLLQPSELAKLTMAIYFSALLTKKNKLWQFFITLTLIGLLIIMEPDLGTAIVIIGMGVFTYFGSGGKILPLLGFGMLGLIGVLLMVAISPYRSSRLKSYIDSSHDPLGASYQIRQALVALGSGNIFGLGLGQSRQKYNFLPETTTDSIYAIIGEELGLVGSVAVLLAFLILILRGFSTAAVSHPGFSLNLALSLTSLIGLQSFINISAITALVPLTGIPLTYISYGGSSLLIMLLATGILVNISRVYDTR